MPDGTGRESAFFVARDRPSGGTLVLGRGLYEIYALQQSVLRALALGIGPTILIALLAGIMLSFRAATRLRAIHLAIDRVIQGDLRERLPASRVPDGIDEVVRSVNRMLDEISRLMIQLKQVGDNIAHDLRTPLTVAHIRLERALDEPADQLRATAQQNSRQSRPRARDRHRAVAHLRDGEWLAAQRLRAVRRGRAVSRCV